METRLRVDSVTHCAQAIASIVRLAINMEDLRSSVYSRDDFTEDGLLRARMRIIAADSQLGWFNRVLDDVSAPELYSSIRVAQKYLGVRIDIWKLYALVRRTRSTLRELSVHFKCLWELYTAGRDNNTPGYVWQPWSEDLEGYERAVYSENNGAFRKILLACLRHATDVANDVN